MPYILDVMNKTIEPRAECISLERYVLENSFITRYLSRVVKDKALAVYHVLFILSWFENGHGEIVVPWGQVGAFIRSEQGNIIDNTTVKRRLPDLFTNQCISVNRVRGNANMITVHLPSNITACRVLIDQEERDALIQTEINDERDYYNDSQRRLSILERDGYRCVYCTILLTQDTFVLDHLIPVSKGGTNHKHNLVTACELCNQRRSDSDPIPFLLENYRQQLITQGEFLRIKIYIESLIAEKVDNGVK